MRDPRRVEAQNDEAAMRPGRPSTSGNRQLEWFSACVMVGWSIILALPGDSLAAPQFAAFHRLGLTETFWTALFGFVGAGRLVALYINGKSPRTPYARMLGALFGFLSWGQVAIQVGQGGYNAYGAASTGIAPYGLLAVAELISIYRASYDARYVTR